MTALTEGQKAEGTKVFRAFEKSDDQAPVKDLKAMLEKLGTRPTGDWLEKVQDDIDPEATGFMTLEEFLETYRSKRQADEDERELKEIFRILDKGHKGEIPTSVVREILKELGGELTEEDIDDMIADVDTDGSGLIDYDEFCSLMLG